MFLSYVDAVLGTDIKVPTLSGFVKMKVPGGISNGQLMRLKNKGINELNRHRCRRSVCKNEYFYSK